MPGGGTMNGTGRPGGERTGVSGGNARGGGDTGAGAGGAFDNLGPGIARPTAAGAAGL